MASLLSARHRAAMANDALSPEAALVVRRRHRRHRPAIFKFVIGRDCLPIGSSPVIVKVCLRSFHGIGGGGGVVRVFRREADYRARNGVTLATEALELRLVVVVVVVTWGSKRIAVRGRGGGARRRVGRASCVSTATDPWRRLIFFVKLPAEEKGSREKREKRTPSGTGSIIGIKQCATAATPARLRGGTVSLAKHEVEEGAEGDCVVSYSAGQK